MWTRLKTKNRKSFIEKVLRFFYGEYRIRTDHLPDCHRDALVLFFNQIFDIYSAFHFLDLHFSLTSFRSRRIGFEIF